MGDFKVTKDWDSSEDKTESDTQKRTAVDRIKEKVNQYIEKRKQERAYKKTPEYMKKQIDRINQLAELEIARSKLESAKTKIAKSRSARFNAQANWGIFSNTGILAKEPSFSGMDSLFGFSGTPQKSRRSSSQTSMPTRGFDELFGI